MNQQTFFEELQESGIALDEAASQLEVSGATIRNWIKTGYLEQISRGFISVESYNHFKKNVEGSEKF